MSSELPPPRFAHVCGDAHQGRRSWHAWQRPQPFCIHETPTRSPVRSAVTPAPTSTMVPTGSCPRTNGGVTRGTVPRWTCRSVPHIPDASTRITTWPSAGRGSGTSLSSQLSLKRVMTAARMVYLRVRRCINATVGRAHGSTPARGPARPPAHRAAGRPRGCGPAAAAIPTSAKMADAPRNFLADIVAADLAAGRNGGKVVTRFPPEPNGFLHIGHAKSILLNFGLAKAFGGRTHLRFDDTNPVTEEAEYVDAIQGDVRWLGCEWGRHLYYASDFFPRMYECAERLVREGKAYVDTQAQEAIREQRGSFERPGTNSPFRDRPAAESLDLLRRMKAGEFPDGAMVLRARIDMAHPNVLMRDPLLYRIRHAHHHRTGDAWCIYPMYDFAHPLEDAFEGVTHSICTLEFESNRELYDWVLDHLGPWDPRPRQYEFARLALGYTVMSKRKLLQLVNEGRVSGWDDPRMPTIAGLRRRGVTPEALRDFADLIGVAKNNSVVDIGKLEFAIRNDLERRSPRALAVLNPLKLVIESWPEGRDEELEVPWWPGDPGRGGRKVPFGRDLLIERDDFSLDP